MVLHPLILSQRTQFNYLILPLMCFPTPAVLICPQKTPRSRCLKGSQPTTWVFLFRWGRLKLLVTVDTIHKMMSLIMWSGHGDHISHGYETLTHKPLKYQLNCLNLKTYSLSLEKYRFVGDFFKDSLRSSEIWFN